MSVTNSISDDGHVRAQHNSGRGLWERRVSVDEWGESDAPPDLAIAEAVELFLVEVDCE